VGAIWWVLTLGWAAVMFEFSTRSFAPEFTGRLLAAMLHSLHLNMPASAFGLLHALVRKLAHVVEYGIFGLFLYGVTGDPKQPGWRPRRALICILIAAAYSATDEFHQRFVAGRHAAISDCGLDTIGATLAMLIFYVFHQFALRRELHATRTS